MPPQPIIEYPGMGLQKPTDQPVAGYEQVTGKVPAAQVSMGEQRAAVS